MVFGEKTVDRIASELTIGDFLHIRWQTGPIPDGVNGTTIEAVMQILIDRLRGFNAGQLSCRENSLAIAHLEEAQNWLLRRRENRIAAGVEGTMQPHSGSPGFVPMRKPPSGGSDTGPSAS